VGACESAKEPDAARSKICVKTVKTRPVIFLRLSDAVPIRIANVKVTWGCPICGVRCRVLACEFNWRYATDRIDFE
jgi:hypothetical protein